MNSIKSCHIGLRWSSKVSGGAERVFADLAGSLPEAGVAFTGIVAGPPSLATETDGLIHAFAAENAGTMTRMLGARREITRLLAAHQPDLLASHFALYTAPILDRLGDRPFIMHFHGPWALESKLEGASSIATFGKSALERAVYRRANQSIVLSEAFATLLEEEYGVPPETIHVVPGAVDLERFEPVLTRRSAREVLSWPTDRPIILSVRRLVNRMGLQQLLSAVALIRQTVPDVLCYIAGTGAIRQELERLVEERDLRRNVTFLGFLPDELLSTAYRAADITVVPTVALEGFGLVAAESLAAGTPVMVTPVGGLPDVVQKLSGDLIFRSGSPADLAEALSAALLGETKLPDEIACRKYAVENFSRGLMASRVAAIYRKTLGR